jgi:hypothetical protein
LLIKVSENAGCVIFSLTVDELDTLMDPNSDVKGRLLVRHADLPYTLYLIRDGASIAFDSGDSSVSNFMLFTITEPDAGKLRNGMGIEFKIAAKYTIILRVDVSLPTMKKSPNPYPDPSLN